MEIERKKLKTKFSKKNWSYATLLLLFLGVIFIWAFSIISNTHCANIPTNSQEDVKPVDVHEVKANQKHFEEAEHCCSVREAFLDIGDTNEWLEELDWEEDIPEDEPVQCCDDILDFDNEEPLCSLQLELVDDDEQVDSDVTDVVEEHDNRAKCEVVVVVRAGNE